MLFFDGTREVFCGRLLSSELPEVFGQPALRVYAFVDGVREVWSQDQSREHVSRALCSHGRLGRSSKEVPGPVARMPTLL